MEEKLSFPASKIGDENARGFDMDIDLI